MWRYALTLSRRSRRPLGTFLRVSKDVAILHITLKTIVFLYIVRTIQYKRDQGRSHKHSDRRRNGEEPNAGANAQEPDPNTLTSKTWSPSNSHATHSPTSFPQPRTPSPLPPLSHSVPHLYLRLYHLDSLHHYHPFHPSRHHQPDSLHSTILRHPGSRTHGSNTSPSRRQHRHSTQQA